MIKSLTKEQENKIPIYLDKYLQQGYRTETVDNDKAKTFIDFLYTDLMSLEKPKYYIFLDSPMACQLACNLLKNIKFCVNDESQLWSQLGSQLESQLWSQLRSQLELQLESQLGSQLWSQLESQLGSQLESQLGSQLGSQLWSQLESQLGSQLGSQLRSQLWSQLRPQLWSQLESQNLDYYNIGDTNWWCGWIGFYDYILNELFPNQVVNFTKFQYYKENFKEVHMFIPFNEIVFISDFPEKIILNANKLHSTNNKALQYRDGYGMFALNGKVIDFETPLDGYLQYGFQLGGI